jgi:hypothetical protein
MDKESKLRITGRLPDETTQVLAWSHYREGQASRANLPREEMLSVERQKYVDSSFESGGEDMRILRVNNPRLGFRLVRRRGTHKLKIQVSNLLVEA